MGLIQDKITGKAIDTEQASTEPPNIINLMDALAASLERRNDGKHTAKKKQLASLRHVLHRNEKRRHRSRSG